SRPRSSAATAPARAEAPCLRGTFVRAPLPGPARDRDARGLRPGEQLMNDDHAAGATSVLVTLAAGQFLMTLDTSVMNVAIATVAKDVGTDVTGIQTAITLYTLVMATLMITGGKVGALIGRKRAFAIGCVIYGAGSFTTSIAQSLPVLIVGWSFLEGVGAALILPAIVALVAANFGPRERPRAYGLVMAAGAVAVAVGPLIGGLFTTYLSWRLVFAVLRSSVWGWVSPKPDAPSLFGISAVLWFVLGGLFLIWLFFEWEKRLERRDAEPLVRPSMLRNPQLLGGLR